MAYGMAGMPGNQRQVGLPRGMSGFPVVGNGLGGMPVRKSGVIKPYELPSFYMGNTNFGAGPYDSLYFDIQEQCFYTMNTYAVIKYSLSGALVFSRGLLYGGSSGDGGRGFYVYGDHIYVNIRSPNVDYAMHVKLDRFTGNIVSYAEFPVPAGHRPFHCFANEYGVFSIMNDDGSAMRLVRTFDGGKTHKTFFFPNGLDSHSIFTMKEFSNKDLLVMGGVRNSGGADHSCVLTKVNAVTTTPIWSKKITSATFDRNYSKVHICKNGNVFALMVASNKAYMYLLNGSDGSHIASKQLSVDINDSASRYAVTSDDDSNIFLVHSSPVNQFKAAIFRIKNDLSEILAQKITTAGTVNLALTPLRFSSGKLLITKKSYDIAQSSFVNFLISIKPDLSEFSKLPAGFEQFSSWVDHNATLLDISTGPSSSAVDAGVTLSAATDYTAVSGQVPSMGGYGIGPAITTLI